MEWQKKLDGARRNGHGSDQSAFTEDMREELQRELRRELMDVKAGKTENVVYLTALADNWSADYLRQVAKRRGQNWRFLTALTDQILQAEGWALLAFATTAEGVDMSEFMLRKTFVALDRADQIADEYEGKGMLDARRVHHLEKHKDFLEELSEQGRAKYFGRVGRMLSGGDSYD